jgi:ferredoxin
MGGVIVANRLCREIGHAWQQTTIKGWFRCARAGCDAYGACATCVLSVPRGAQPMQCQAHRAVQTTLQRK